MSDKRFAGMSPTDRLARERTYVEQALEAIVAFATSKGFTVTVDERGVMVTPKTSFDTIQRPR